MNQFQKGINVNSIEEFFEYLTPSESRTSKILYSLITETLPEVREKISYNVPFFYRKKNICFIWPASIPWGGLSSGVALGFTKGHLLSDPEDYLEKGQRKYVRMKTFQSSKDIDHDQILAFLFEAYEIDQI